jgi:hypothetical protein
MITARAEGTATSASGTRRSVSGVLAEPPPPQYVFVPRNPDHKEWQREEVILAQWNMAWEWGHIRPERFRGEIPRRLHWIERHPEVNFRLVPLASAKAGGKVDSYGPIYSLLPLATLERFGLLPRSATWPPMIPVGHEARVDAADQLARALPFTFGPCFLRVRNQETFREPNLSGS